MEVNWASIQNHPISSRQKPRKVSNPSLEGKVTFVEYLENSLDEAESPSQKKKHKESRIDYEI